MDQDHADIDHVARLANLELAAAERSRLQDEFHRIIAFVETLRTKDADEAAVTNQVTDLENIYRSDTVEPFPHQRSVLEAAAHRHDDLIRAPNVFDRTGGTDGG